MFSSRKISGLIEVTYLPQMQRSTPLEKRNVREECCHLHRIALALQIAGTAK
jgi:hypothetical protein